MQSIFFKEINQFFSSAIGYIVIVVFLIIMGLFLWVFPEFSILNHGFASMQQLFEISPWIFIFLIPAITMRSFSEELESGTIELLATKPITDFQIIFGKFLAGWALTLLALIPTAIYYYSVYQLGSPVGNLDRGAILGSYIGLALLAGVFTAIGIFASSLTRNQIVAFIIGVFLCFLLYKAFSFISILPSFVGTIDFIIERIGIEYHYLSISSGLIDTRDVIYFVSLIAFFIFLTVTKMKAQKW